MAAHPGCAWRLVLVWSYNFITVSDWLREWVSEWVSEWQIDSPPIKKIQYPSLSPFFRRMANVVANVCWLSSLYLQWNRTCSSLCFSYGILLHESQTHWNWAKPSCTAHRNTLFVYDFKRHILLENFFFKLCFHDGHKYSDLNHVSECKNLPRTDG